MTAMGDLQRTSYCGSVDEAQIGRSITLMGWVDRRRDLGNLIFLDLRDREGCVQVVVGPSAPAALEMAKSVRAEYVLAVHGKVIQRSEETVNSEMKTGKIEVQAEEIRVLNRSETPPFPIHDSSGSSEETRLRYRFLDLRRARLQRNLRLRHQIALETRKHLDERGFLEIETPFLTKSTPEGARDYLVPSRVQPGQFYALPQSPQLFKQLLMISGFDKYFQIVRCFRDEDLRADRQPEFTQVDIEMSFPTQETVFEVVESLLARIFKVVGIEVKTPFLRLPYDESMRRFGTDRPDTRFGLELVDVRSAFAETPFQIFRKVLNEQGLIRGFRIPGASGYSRKELDDLAEVAKTYGAAAISWLKSTAEGLKSSLPKMIPLQELEKVAELAEMRLGDLFILVAATPKVTHDSLAALRLHLALKENLIPADAYNLLWVYDFPLVAWDEAEGRFFSLHHPFTSPHDQDIALLDSDPGAARAKAYDVVLNGLEIGGGSIRIHRPELQRKIFDVLGIGDEEAAAKFGFFLEALRYGTPPHGGIALGLDRMAMLLAGEKSIRDVIAFPKTAKAIDLMCGAPSDVSPAQLRELSIKLARDE